MERDKMSEYIYSNGTSISLLSCEDAFKELTEKEKLYAHYLSRASWYGGLIDLVQTSVESPLIFILLHKVFKNQSIPELKEIALEQCDFNEDEFLAFLIYACGVFGNIGNYKGFGDKKFVPNLLEDKLEKLLLSSRFAKEAPEEIKKLLSLCFDSMFSLKSKERNLGFPYNATSTYFSKNITEDDLETVNNFLKKKNLEAWNTRLFKLVDELGRSTYEVRLASVLQTKDEEGKNLICTENLNGHKFIVTRGDYSPLLKLVNDNLSKAKEYAANDIEERMLEKYIQSFHTGSIDAHKEGSRLWVQDKGPVIESYIGFLETYRDPCGARGEFRGFVAMVNKKMSMKFNQLVNSAESLLLLLPWPKDFENDKFLQPDFTSLDVLTFANSRVPAGINIPNYNDVKQTDGFKNVSLGNTMSLRKKDPPNFLCPADQELILQYGPPSFDVNVGLHELLGHGSGKLFIKKQDGSCNFDAEKVLNFETGKLISSWYEEGESYHSLFGVIKSSYEECRAECVALYLCNEPDVLRNFGYEGSEAENIVYAVWLSMVLSGLYGLSTYNPLTETWLQAHSQARFVILQVLLENGGNFITLEKVQGEDGKPDILLSLDKTKIIDVGKPAIGNFLRKLQLYRCIADVASAKEMYNKYSEVRAEGLYPFLEFREIVVARGKPGRILVQANTFIEDGSVKLQNYESSFEGMIQSWVERFQDVDVDIDLILEDLWAKDKHFFL